MYCIVHNYITLKFSSLSSCTFSAIVGDHFITNISDVVDKLLYHIFRNCILFFLANVSAGNCGGPRYGCYNKTCWKYVEYDRTNAWDWWCYTQEAGINERIKKWQTCNENSDCSWNRTCGDCVQYNAYEKSSRIVC
jgi:hypothetical protein